MNRCIQSTCVYFGFQITFWCGLETFQWAAPYPALTEFWATLSAGDMSHLFVFGLVWGGCQRLLSLSLRDFRVFGLIRGPSYCSYLPSLAEIFPAKARIKIKPDQTGIEQMPLPAVATQLLALSLAHGLLTLLPSCSLYLYASIAEWGS